MKVPVFFRTRNQLEALKNFSVEINATIRQKVGWALTSAVTMTTKYSEKTGMFDNIPKNKPGKKKYMAVFHANKEKMDRLGIDLERMLSKIDGIELVRRGDDGAKYKGEKTTATFPLTSEEQFKTIIRDFDNAFGQGNWRMKGPKNMHQLVKRVEEARSTRDNPWLLNYVRQYADGVPVRIIVNQPNVDLNKYLFKVKLKA